MTPRFLRHGDRFVGALAVDAHMRRQKTTKASTWRRLEAQLNLLRLHSSLLFTEVSMAADQMVPTFDPVDTAPEAAARMVRAQWCMPIGPVVNLTRRLETAGCLVFATTDRMRLTLAHDLGHLCLHTSFVSDDMEGEANRFAAEFLMPEDAIRHQLRRPELGALLDLKREWGVSMQALYERAYHLGLVTGTARQQLYRMLNARGWKSVEPYPDRVPRETPELPSHIGSTLHERGLDTDEINELVGVVRAEDNPFQQLRLRVV
ncbi:MAG: ImmA/IrrE family metallo-endopeptidase [Actinomycetia bacterium]|nr:ImmA/IrrE family metallo-endopeptidase [Actinomycetes bacterium]